jgi:hypothetical protein
MRQGVVDEMLSLRKEIKMLGLLYFRVGSKGTLRGCDKCKNV